jgi:hypothetical protein
MSDNASFAITPEQVLSLAGRLDDAPGFDTPRERFRRFLTERVTSVPDARTLILDWQHSAREQHHRALQDAVTILGRFLGFETEFGASPEASATTSGEGHWRSRHRLHVLLEIRTHRSAVTGFESLSRLVAESAEMDSDPARLGLCVVTPHYSGRPALENALSSGWNHVDVRLVSTESLLALAELVALERLGHDEVVRLLWSTSNLDFVVNLLTDTRSPAREPLADADQGTGPYWMALVANDGDVAPHQIVDVLIGKRHVLGITDSPQVRVSPQTDDWVCFLVPGAGIAGHAQIASIAEESADFVRDSDRFTRVMRLKNVELYDEPVRVGMEKERRLLGPIGLGDNSGPILTPMSQRDFSDLTRVREEPTAQETRSRVSVHPIGPRPIRGVPQAADGGT